VVHIDEGAIAAVSRAFQQIIPPDSVVLDLMSSWRSHWPPEHPKRRMVGLGMNFVELDNNPDLDEHLVHNINENPILPFEDDTFDAVVITVSVQYLTRPVETFQQINRVLKPGGVVIVTFSNRCFPTKAIAVWRGMDDANHARLVGYYFVEAGGFDAPEFTDLSPAPGHGDPLYLVHARKAAG